MFADRLDAVCARDLDNRTLRAEVLSLLDGAVGFDASVWLLTDPETCVGCNPLADVPASVDLPSMIRAKYLTTVNRWSALEPSTAISLLAGGLDRPADSDWCRLLAEYGIDDVVSTVFRDAYGCWGFLDLWRAEGGFTGDEIGVIGELARVVTPALRRSLAQTFIAASDPVTIAPPPGPAVLLLTDELRPAGQTPHSDAYLRALLPTPADRSPIPAGALNVAAQLLAIDVGVGEHPAWARSHLGGGGWVTLRADRIEHGGDSSVIAVSIERSTPAERTAMYAAVTGLSARERELMSHVVTGATTRELASRLFVSEHTVQDHLKSIFAKTGVNSRTALVARATGVAH